MSVWMVGRVGTRTRCALGPGEVNLWLSSSLFPVMPRSRLYCSDGTDRQAAAGGWGEGSLGVCDPGVTVPFLAGPNPPGSGGHRCGQGESSPCPCKDCCCLQPRHRLPRGAGEWDGAMGGASSAPKGLSSCSPAPSLGGAWCLSQSGAVNWRIPDSRISSACD